MRTLEVHRDIAASAETVWNVITEVEGMADTLTGVTRVERVDDGDGFGVGTRWRETRVVMKREATEEMEVTAVDPGRSYTVESDSRGVHYHSVLSVEAAGDGSSRLTMTFGGEPTTTGSKITGALMGPLMTGPMRKMLQQDLDDIAAAAERRPSSP